MYRLEFHGVVLRANSRGIQQETKDLGVSPGSPSGEQIQREERPHSPREAVQEIENARPHDERKEEELALRSEDRERPIQ